MTRWLREQLALHIAVAAVVLVGLFMMFDWRMAIVVAILGACMYVAAIVMAWLPL
jgi:hypothetical protein